MKRIGLFLSVPCSGSGVSHYCKSVLFALLELPQDEYSLVVAYADPAWVKFLSRDVEHLHLRFGRFFSLGAALWSLLRLPHNIWLRWSGFFSTVRDVMRQGCNLWVFPCQDIWSSRFPVPSLSAIHDLMHRYEPHFPEAGGRGRHWFRDGYLADACEYSAGILVDSKLGAQHVLDSYAPEPSKIIVLPYVPLSYRLEASDSEDFSAKYQLAHKFLFYPAEFWPHKNHFRLIAAVARVRERCPDIQLVLSGRLDKEYARVRSYANKLDIMDCIRFVGYVPEMDMAEIYRRARGLIFPSFFGPTNIPPLEAFVWGCPVALSAIYGMPEQVGDAAIFFDPSSTENIAECIAMLWQDDMLCCRLRQKGLEKSRLWGFPQFTVSLHLIIAQLINSNQYWRRHAFSSISRAHSYLVPDG